jgi:hypothetical protein
MGIYKEPNSEEIKIVKKYSKSFEDIKVSDPVLFAGNTYKEVTFERKGAAKVLRKEKGYIYIDSNNKVVEDEKMIMRLGRIFFFMDAFLNDDKDSIIRALQNDEEVEKNKVDFKLMMKGFDIIEERNKKYDIEHKEVVKVKDILNKLIDLRANTNIKLEAFLKVVEEAMSKQEYFDENIIDTCMPAYKEVMNCNYEKVKLIARGASSYNYLKKAAEKVRKQYAIRFNVTYTDPLMKVNYMMGYFESLIRAYETIINMSYGQYMKSIENSGKINAEYKLMELRNKKNK